MLHTTVFMSHLFKMHRAQLDKEGRNSQKIAIVRTSQQVGGHEITWACSEPLANGSSPHLANRPSNSS